jgi:hypothetical protein
MSKEELIKATQILQKCVPNRFPLKNSYIEAMREYAEWYHEKQSKLHQPTVMMSFDDIKNGILEHKAKSEYKQASIVIVRNVFKSNAS